MPITDLAKFGSDIIKIFESKDADKIQDFFVESESFSAEELAVLHEKILEFYGDDLDREIYKKFTLLSFAVGYGHSSTVQFLLDHKVKKDATILPGGIIDMASEKNLRLLFQGDRADLYLPNEWGLNFYDCFAASISSEKNPKRKAELKSIFAESLREQNPQITDEEIEQKRSFSLAKMMLKLLYSEDHIGIDAEVDLAAIILEVMPALNLDSSEKARFSAILDKISKKEDFVKGNKRFVVEKSSIQQHSSYFVIECKNNIPLRVTYVDSEAANESEESYGYAAITAEIDNSKCRNLDELVERLEKSSIEDLKDELNTFVKFNSNSQVELVGRVVSRAQKRDNCKIKSLMDLVRFLDEVINDKKCLMSEEREPVGEGYESYKIFRYALIEHYAQQAKKMADLGDKSLLEKITDHAKGKASDEKERTRDLADVVLKLSTTKKLVEFRVPSGFGSRD